MRSCAMQVRLQRPTISAEMSFLLAVMKFYIPDFAIASVTPIPFQTQDVLLSGQPDYFDWRKMPPMSTCLLGRAEALHPGSNTLCQHHCIRGFSLCTAPEKGKCWLLLPWSLLVLCAWRSRE